MLKFLLYNTIRRKIISAKRICHTSYLLTEILIRLRIKLFDSASCFINTQICGKKEHLSFCVFISDSTNVRHNIAQNTCCTKFSLIRFTNTENNYSHLQLLFYAMPIHRSKIPIPTNTPGTFSSFVYLALITAGLLYSLYLTNK